jgi:hypothetical protein
MFCAPGLVFSGNVGVWSRLHDLRSRTRFRWYRGRRVSFSCFAHPDSFSAVPTTLGPILMFCGPELVFSDAEGVGSRFHVLRSRTHFQRYRGRRFPFSCFAHPDSFSAVPWASGQVFMFCAPGLDFGGTGLVFRVAEGVGSRVHVLAPGIVFGGTESAASRFHVMRSRTRFRCYRVRRGLFSCFACNDSFSAVTWASGSAIMFCAP